MEKENQHNRTSARIQYNQTVARLVDLCKKLDPRYLEAVAKRQEEADRKEEERRIREEAEQRRREEALQQQSVTMVWVCVKVER